ncbi:glycosyltransferase family 4 protein [Caenispirillum bisanense]|uniref:Glycosyltransferase involved in cell wall bisynthesis n=1 Tax=Caenispirillum bisanense TaxID=414052 RepID=A0A286G8B0_9PROT|nr:glycosyltransferase family 4 protein [Caenispirillum bisanense]SOD91763.1 Glycosyltransferase involved in cell wall bisynthesis [Caenispirillum bisanense]
MNADSSTSAALDKPGRTPPTILQVLPRLETGGVERGTIEIAEGIVQAGGRALVASEGGRMVRELTRVGADHVTLPLASKNPLVIRRNIERLKTLIGERGVSLVHARSRAPAWSARAAARALGVPFVTTFHGTYNLGPMGLKRAYNAVMADGDRVIAISEFIRSHIARVYGVSGDRVTVIHRGVDFARFDPDRVSQERMIQLVQRWRLPDGVPVIVLPGRLTRWKGQEVLIRALAKVRHRPVRALLVGSDQGRTAYSEELRALIERLDLVDSVHLVGDCDDMPAVYKLADVVVSASTDPEAFGRVVAEGAAMGRPVIAPNHGAAPEIIASGGETGWLFWPESADDLARALDEALALSPAERDALSLRAVARMRAEFGKDKMVDRTLAVYAELLGLDSRAVSP